MGFLDKATDLVKGQFLDTIEYVGNESNKIIVYKYRRNADGNRYGNGSLLGNNEIKQGASVIVREGQAAIFVSGGQIADIFTPGTYTLNTGNLPILSSLKAVTNLFNSPVKSDLYFVSTTMFYDNKWATKNAIMMRDEELGMMRLRAFGKYSFKIDNIELFAQEVLGAQNRFLSYEIVQYLTSIFVEALGETIANSGLRALDLALKYRELATKAIEIANNKAQTMGIYFNEAIIENISLPDNVEQLIDEQSGINLANKNMDGFMKYQAARAMRDSAKTEGGVAGIGAGIALGKTIVKELTPNEEKGATDNIEMIKKLKSLLDEGIISQEEFDLKKKQLLGL